MKTPFILLFFLAAPLLQTALAGLAPATCPEAAGASAHVADPCTCDPSSKPTTPPSAKPAPETKTRRLPPAVLRA
jgi:hypothetical protein